MYIILYLFENHCTITHGFLRSVWGNIFIITYISLFFITVFSVSLRAKFILRLRGFFWELDKPRWREPPCSVSQDWYQQTLERESDRNWCNLVCYCLFLSHNIPLISNNITSLSSESLRSKLKEPIGTRFYLKNPEKIAQISLIWRHPGLFHKQV